MKKMLLVVVSVLAMSFAFTEDIVSEDVAPEKLLPVASTGSLGVEAATTFTYDIENKSAGLETKAGIELYLPLFGVEDRGVMQESYDKPGVRFVIENMSFTWLNTYQATGGNYEQDHVNSWVSKPLVLTFDEMNADVVYKNFFL